MRRAVHVRDGLGPGLDDGKADVHLAHRAVARQAANGGAVAAPAVGGAVEAEHHLGIREGRVLGELLVGRHLEAEQPVAPRDRLRLLAREHDRVGHRLEVVGRVVVVPGRVHERVLLDDHGAGTVELDFDQDDL